MSASSQLHRAAAAGAAVPRVPPSPAAASLDFARDYDDPYAADAPPLEVDRRRVLQSAAFRRLQHKTQVFVAGHGDHYRTRAAHSLEVGDLARSIARRLGLNGDLAEIVGLAHDLGHAPFGHAGERALDECCRNAWRRMAGVRADADVPPEHRFEHNAQSLRVVEHLEHPYPEFRGLNLTRAVRQCLRTHTTRFDRAGDAPAETPPLEGQVVALADELTYLLHDLQDGVYAGLLAPEQLSRLELWREHSISARPDEEAGGHSAHGRFLRTLRPSVDRIRAAILDDLAAEFALPARGAAGGAASGAAAGPRIGPSAAMRERLKALGDLLLADVYGHSTVVRMDAKARRIISAVFDAYVAKPELMPRRFAARVSAAGGESAARVAADYIAGMTDRFCQEEHARLFDPRMEA